MFFEVAREYVAEIHESIFDRQRDNRTDANTLQSKVYGRCWAVYPQRLLELKQKYDSRD